MAFLTEMKCFLILSKIEYIQKKYQILVITKQFNLKAINLEKWNILKKFLSKVAINSIEFFAINTKFPMLSMLVSNVFTATKKLPPVGLDLMISALRV